MSAYSAGEVLLSYFEKPLTNEVKLNALEIRQRKKYQFTGRRGRNELKKEVGDDEGKVGKRKGLRNGSETQEYSHRLNSKNQGISHIEAESVFLLAFTVWCSFNECVYEWDIEK